MMRILILLAYLSWPVAGWGQTARDVQSGYDAIAAMEDRASDWLIRIGGIVSPSGEEHQRADTVAALFRGMGIADVERDAQPNVVARIPGRSGRAIVFVATLDDLASVAQHQRAAAHGPVRNDRRIEGPGTNTSLVTVAVLLLAQQLIDEGYAPEHDLVFAAVAQEETGLTGMKALYETWKDRAIVFIDVLGPGESISYGALGIHWWKVVARGPAGHTLNGGLPNVNRGIARAVDRIFALPHPVQHADARTALNIARLQSGTVFNHKPDSGWFSLDLRSLEGNVIADMEASVQEILRDVAQETSITFEMVPETLVPGGQIAGFRDSPIVQAAMRVAQERGAEGRLTNAGSSNMNVALAGGTPAIGLGGERGGRRGFPDEWASLDTLIQTAQVLYGVMRELEIRN